MARWRTGRYRGDSEFCDCRDIGGESEALEFCFTHDEYVLDCLCCGRYFHTRRPHTKYCSTACSQKAYRVRRLEVVV